MKHLATLVLLSASCFAQWTMGVMPQVATPTVTPSAGSLSGSSPSYTISESVATATLTWANATSGATINTCYSASATCSPATSTNPQTMSASGYYCAQGAKTGYISSATVCVQATVATGPTQIASDTFTAADNTGLAVGGNWTYAHGSGTELYINTNRLGVLSSADYNILAYWSGTGSFNANQYSLATVVAVDGSWNALGVAVRVSGTGGTGQGRGYVAMWANSNQLSLGKMTAGGDPTVLKATADCGTVAATDVIELDASGTTTTVLTVKKQTGGSGSFTTVCTYSDSSSPLTTGVPGVYGNGSTAQKLDNWAGGNL